MVEILDKQMNSLRQEIRKVLEELSCWQSMKGMGYNAKFTKKEFIDQALDAITKAFLGKLKKKTFEEIKELVKKIKSEKGECDKYAIADRADGYNQSQDDIRKMWEGE